ncbi:hypothetical protein BS17DRAFT_815276 [Gyrodon lividus]|nr:hypothetical protein BS17DRAFT_815276 [Gyrodon lividus]
MANNLKTSQYLNSHLKWHLPAPFAGGDNLPFDDHDPVQEPHGAKDRPTQLQLPPCPPPNVNYQPDNAPVLVLKAFGEKPEIQMAYLNAVIANIFGKQTVKELEPCQNILAQSNISSV